jgi:crotonobetaine/carnitine-CoA ligase
MPCPAPEMFEAIPREARTLFRLWNRALAWGPDRQFVSFEGADYRTYAEVGAQARFWASVYTKLGTDKSDRIALMLPNSTPHLEVMLGALLSSRPVVPVNLMHRGAMLEHTLTDSQARVLITEREYLERLKPEWDLPHLEHIIVLDSIEGVSDLDISARIHGAATLRREVQTKSEPFDSDQRFSDVAAILYTSGTTGPSKGAVVTFEYFLYSMWHQSSAMQHSESDVLFTTLPMFHVNALFVTLFPAVFTGARAVVYRHFSATRFWDQIVENGATHFSAIGTMGNILMKRPQSDYRPEHRLRCCQITPAPDEEEGFEQRFGVPIFHGYGMTEANIIRPSRDGSFRPALAGRNHPYYELAVVDDDDAPVPVGEIGEIVVRPTIPGIMFREYLGRPEATAEAFRNLWFHTGDHGRLDVNGDLFFQGRKKDAIRRRGENVSAYEVEREVGRFPGVADVAAIAVNSELGEEEVMVCVTALDGVTLSAGELHAYCVDNLPKFMVPRFIDIRPSLPKNASARILKHELRAEGVRKSTWDAEIALRPVP